MSWPLRNGSIPIYTMASHSGVSSGSSTRWQPLYMYHHYYHYLCFYGPDDAKQKANKNKAKKKLVWRETSSYFRPLTPTPPHSSVPHHFVCSVPLAAAVAAAAAANIASHSRFNHRARGKCLINGNNDFIVLKSTHLKNGGKLK